MASRTGTLRPLRQGPAHPMAGLRSCRPTQRGRRQAQLFDPKQGIAVTAENINVTGSIGSPLGPFGFVGSAVVNGTALKFDASVGRWQETAPTPKDRYKATVSLQTDTGTCVSMGQPTHWRRVRMSSASCPSLPGRCPISSSPLFARTGQQAPSAQAGLTGKFTFDGGIDVSPTKLP